MILKLIILLIIIYILRKPLYYIFDNIRKVLIVCLILCVSGFSINYFVEDSISKSYEIASISKLPIKEPVFTNNLPLKRTHLGWTTKNPGNIRPFRNYSKYYKGATIYDSGSKGKFISFPNFKMGYSAMVNDINAKKSGKSRYTDGSESLKEVLYIYCPPIENDSHNYTEKVSKLYGCKSDTPIKYIDVDRLVMCMIYIENPQIFKYLFT